MSQTGEVRDALEGILGALGSAFNDEAIRRGPVLPPHVYLTIIHNQHVDYCMSIGAWLENELCNGERSGFARDSLIKPDDRAAILASGEAWVIDWCPSTSVGSCTVYAATLQRALELANNGEWG